MDNSTSNNSITPMNFRRNMPVLRQVQLPPAVVDPVPKAEPIVPQPVPQQVAPPAQNAPPEMVITVTTVEGVTGTSVRRAQTRPGNNQGVTQFGQLQLNIKYGTRVLINGVEFNIGYVEYESVRHDGRITVPQGTEYNLVDNPSGFSMRTVKDEEIFLHASPVVTLPEGIFVRLGDYAMRLYQNTPATLI